MKQFRLTSAVLIFFLLFSLEGQAQFIKEVLKAVGEAATESVTESTSNNRSGSSPQSASSRRVTGFKIVSPHPDLEIKVKRCAMSGTTAVIDMIITNYGRDTEIYFVGGNNGSEVFDDEGNLYNQNNVLVGMTGSGMTSYRTDNTSFPTDIPLKFRIQVENVSESIQVFKRINLKGYCNSLGFDKNKPIIIHNIPVTQQ